MKLNIIRVSICLLILFLANILSSEAASIVYEAECSNTLNATINILRDQIKNLESKGLHADDIKEILASFEEANHTGYKPEKIWQIEKTIKIFDYSGFEGYAYSFTRPRSKYSDYNEECALEVVRNFCPGGYRTMGVQLDCKRESISSSNNSGSSNTWSHATSSNSNKIEFPIGQDDLLRSANQGNPVAQYKIGQMYDNGLNVTSNKERAVKWYALSAEQGNRDAQFQLALLHDQGKGVPLNSGIAFKWYSHAAAQGHVVAQYNLGVMYSRGEGVLKDIIKAKEWFTKAAAQGDIDAKKVLQTMN